MMQLSSPVLFGLLAATATVPLYAQDFRTVGTFSSNYVDSGNFHRLDLNGNGLDDLVILSFNQLSTLLDPTLSMTSGTLNTELSTSAFGSGFFGDIFFADFNSDGNIDMGVEYQGIFSFAQFAYVPGDGVGGFGAPVTITQAAGNSGNGTVGDFDGDGQVDLAYWIFPSVGAPVMRIHSQNNGAYTAIHSQVGAGGYPSALSAGDYNGDGFDDICWIDTGVLTIVLGTNGAFAAPMTRTVSSNLNYGFASDLDRDGFVDFIAQSAGSNGWEVDVFWGDATTVFSTPQNVVTMPAPTRSDYLGPFDVDSDGNDELLAVIRNAGAYQLLRHDGARTFSPVPYQTTMAGGMIDLDQDGDLDMITLTSFSAPFQLEENLARYGVACSGAVGVPSLEIGAAIPGTTVDAVLANAAATSLAQIFISLGQNIGPCGPQLDFGQLLYPFAGTTFLWSATDATGSLRLPLQIPSNAPAGSYFLQGIVIDPQGAFNVIGFGLSATEGRAVRVY